MALDLNVDKLLEALGCPKLTIGGKEYVGRYPTFTEHLEFARLWDATDWSDDGSMKATLKAACDRLGFASAYDDLCRLPESAIVEVLHHFLVTSAGRDQRTDMEVTSSLPSAPSV